MRGFRYALIIAALLASVNIIKFLNTKNIKNIKNIPEIGDFFENPLPNHKAGCKI